METQSSKGDYGIFISDIARGVTDELLKEEFSKIGEVSEAVVVKNKHSGETKGYGFVKFYNINDMYAAIDTTTPPVFRDSISGKPQSVKITQADSKNTLFIGRLPKGFTETEIKNELEDIGGVPILSFEFDGPSKINGYANFRDHDSTIKAIKLIQKSQYTASLTPPKSSERDKAPHGATKVLFVRDIKSQSEGDALRKQLGTDLIEKIIVPLDHQKNVPIGHAFIYCNSPNDAKTIMQQNSSLDFQGRVITITWGLPKQKRLEGANFYAQGSPYHQDYPYFYPTAYPDYYYGGQFAGGPFIDPRRSGYGGDPVSHHSGGGGSGGGSKYQDHHSPKRGPPPPPSDYYGIPPHHIHSSKPYGYPPPPHHSGLYTPPPPREYSKPSSSFSKAPPGKYRYNPY